MPPEIPLTAAQVAPPGQSLSVAQDTVQYPPGNDVPVTHRLTQSLSTAQRPPTM